MTSLTRSRDTVGIQCLQGSRSYSLGNVLRSGNFLCGRLCLGLGVFCCSPTLEYIVQCSNILELRVTYCSWIIFQGALQCFHAVENAVLWCQCRLGEMIVAEFQVVEDILGFGYLLMTCW